MKQGDPIHVDGGNLVHLCHPVAYIPEEAGVLWHTVEGNHILLTNDIRGHMEVMIILNERHFCQHYSKTWRLLTDKPTASKWSSEAMLGALLGAYK